MTEYIKDEVRESIFADVHKLRPDIYIRWELNSDGTFRFFDVKFELGDKVWLLHEVYDGNRNMTDYVSLIGSGIDELQFRNPKGAFNDAELKLVELMKDGRSI